MQSLQIFIQNQKLERLLRKSKDEKEIFNINCLKTEKISSVIRKLKDKIADENYYRLKLIFNSKNIDDSEEKKRAQELGIKDNSTIYFIKSIYN